MKKIILIIYLFVITLSCKKQDLAQNIPNIKYDTPYEAFYKTLQTSKLTDTILVQSQTQVFGCGTAAYEYFEELKKSGLDKFYTKYNNVLSDTVLVNEFSKNHNTRILWVTRGNEGEKMELIDPVLHKNTALEKRLWATKNFIKLTETPEKMNSVNIYYSIIYPKEKKYFTKDYKVSEINGIWQSTKVSIDKSENKDFKYAYYPF